MASAEAIVGAAGQPHQRSDANPWGGGHELVELGRADVSSGTTRRCSSSWG